MAKLKVNPALANKVKAAVSGVGNLNPALVRNFPSGLTFFSDYMSRTFINANYSLGDGTGIFTASRSASAPTTYVDANGKINLVTDSNVPVFPGGWYDNTGFHVGNQGLKIEAAGTNYALNSYFSLDTDSDGLADNWISSFGTNSLETCAVNGITGGQAQRNQHTFTAEPVRYAAALTSRTENDSFDASGGSITVTVSFWARGDLSGLTTGTDSNRWLYLGGQTNANIYTETTIPRTLANATTDGLTTSWNKFTFTSTFSNTNTRKALVSFVFMVATDGNRPQAGENYWLEIYGVQVSLSDTSFIPTTTTALSRPAEVLEYAATWNRNAAEETILIKFVPYGSFANDGVARYLSSTSGGNRRFFKSGISASMGAIPNSVESTSSLATYSYETNTHLNGTSYVFAATMKSTGDPNVTIYYNGVSKDSSNTDFVPTVMTNFYLGSNNSGANQLNGIIQRVAIFNRALSASEVLYATNVMNGL